MSFPKHEDGQKPKKGKKQPAKALTLPEPTFVDVTSVADAIESFGRIFSTWVSRELAGDNGQPLYSSPSGYPVKVALASMDGEEEALLSLEIEFAGPVAHSIADSLKRIADAMTPRV